MEASVTSDLRPKVLRGTILCAALLVVGPLDAQISPRAIAAGARPAVVRVTALADGEEVGHGSGFFVGSEGQLVTNHHVVEGATDIRVELETGEIFDLVYLVSFDERRDIVVLQIPLTGTPALPLGDDQRLAVGDPVYVIGSPLGLDGTFSDGLVSGKRVQAGLALIQITAPISPGSSGGPVLNEAGEVIGIATLTLQEGQNVNLAVPARYAGGLLAMHEEPRLFTQVAEELFSPLNQGPPEHAQASSDDVEPWLRVLAEEVAAMEALAADKGYEEVHELVAEMLNMGETYSIEYRFKERGLFAVTGVCDIDCRDLDLGIYDDYGHEVVVDVARDDQPIVDFEVLRPGRFEVRVRMAHCSVEPCGFVVQTFKKGS